MKHANASRMPAQTQANQTARAAKAQRGCQRRTMQTTTKSAASNQHKKT
ncbi:hypothetical protein [Paraburkholderia sp. PGU19]|nr:hypothetical protein [Paraburkholderia sp. PGU19]